MTFDEGAFGMNVPVRFIYWTVRLTTVLWLMVPEVALMVIADVPAGVDGTKTLL